MGAGVTLRKDSPRFIPYKTILIAKDKTISSHKDITKSIGRIKRILDTLNLNLGKRNMELHPELVYPQCGYERIM